MIDSVRTDGHATAIRGPPAVRGGPRSHSVGGCCCSVASRFDCRSVAWKLNGRRGRDCPRVRDALPFTALPFPATNVTAERVGRWSAYAVPSLPDGTADSR